MINQSKGGSLLPYYPGLDGLRGLSILMIIGYHVFNFLPFFDYGWLGVDLFFVLSGYLITTILLAERDKKLGIGNFYIRRVLRIFPIYYLTLRLFVILIPSFFHLPGHVAYYNENHWWFWLYLQNWLFI